MTDATSNGPIPKAPPKDEAATRPAPKVRSGPVFIGDILTASRGRPTLLINWKADSDPDQAE